MYFWTKCEGQIRKCLAEGQSIQKEHNKVLVAKWLRAKYFLAQPHLRDLYI